MFPGELKKTFTQVVRARQEGLAALEKARGETPRSGTSPMLHNSSNGTPH
jgi:hypothetical protein